MKKLVRLLALVALFTAGVCAFASHLDAETPVTEATPSFLSTDGYGRIVVHPRLEPHVVPAVGCHTDSDCPKYITCQKPAGAKSGSCMTSDPTAMDKALGELRRQAAEHRTR